MTTKEKAVNDYIKAKNNQDECIGFIDGYDKGVENTIKSVHLVLLLGIGLGILIGVSFTI